MIALDSVLRAFAQRLVSRADNAYSIDQIFTAIRGEQGTLTAILRQAILRGYLAEAKKTAKQYLPSVESDSSGPPLIPPFGSADQWGDFPIRWPGIESAAQWLYSRNVVSWDQFKALDSQAQSTAFAVANLASVDAVEKVRGALTNAVRTGQGLVDLQQTIRAAIGSSQMSASGVETLYRSYVGLAQAAGQRAVLEHPLVRDEFPYLLFSATHDDRVEASHLAMERWGQNGTAVYRRDDPIWNSLWPPMRWNCRCTVIPLTIADAAYYGSHEAQTWLDTGEPPASTIWASRPYPVTPPSGWPNHRGISV